jgi:hypothetical protein
MFIVEGGAMYDSELPVSKRFFPLLSETLLPSNPESLTKIPSLLFRFSVPLAKLKIPRENRLFEPKLS